MDYDLIVIGSGSVGSAAGYYASQAGLNVLMIDSAMPPHQAGSHHGETRIMRHAYGEGEIRSSRATSTSLVGPTGSTDRRKIISGLRSD